MAREGLRRAGGRRPVPGRRGRERAARAGVQGELVVRRGVDVLDDVDLALVGPVRADHPVGGPGAAASGHVGDVRDEEAVGVGGIGGDADTGTA